MGARTKTTRGYSIKEASELSGLPASTLRYYEAIGLVRPIGRDASSKHRQYTEDDIDHAVVVACLNATGMSTEDMRAYLKNRENGARSAQEQISLLESHKRRLAEEAYSLQLRQRYIGEKIAYWQAVVGGDVAQAKAVAEKARSISQELRASQDLSAQNRSKTSNPDVSAGCKPGACS